MLQRNFTSLHFYFVEIKFDKVRYKTSIFPLFPVLLHPNPNRLRPRALSRQLDALSNVKRRATRIDLGQSVARQLSPRLLPRTVGESTTKRRVLAAQGSTTRPKLGCCFNFQSIMRPNERSSSNRIRDSTRVGTDTGQLREIRHSGN